MYVSPPSATLAPGGLGFKMRGLLGRGSSSDGLARQRRCSLTRAPRHAASQDVTAMVRRAVQSSGSQSLCTVGPTEVWSCGGQPSSPIWPWVIIFDRRIRWSLCACPLLHAGPPWRRHGACQNPPLLKLGPLLPTCLRANESLKSKLISPDRTAHWFGSVGSRSGGDRRDLISPTKAMSQSKALASLLEEWARVGAFTRNPLRNEVPTWPLPHWQQSAQSGPTASFQFSIQIGSPGTLQPR